MQVASAPHRLVLRVEIHVFVPPFRLLVKHEKSALRIAFS
jgi:hypothetical protein